MSGKKEKNDSPAFDWLRQVMSDKGPQSPTTRLVLTAIFLRIDWKTLKPVFEGARSLALRTGLTKTSVLLHLDRAVAEGWLTKTPRASKGYRRGFEYGIKRPSRLNPVAKRIRHRGKRGKHLWPKPKNPVVKEIGQSGQTDCTLWPNALDRISSYSPSSLLNTPCATRPAPEGAALARIPETDAERLAVLINEYTAEQKKEVWRGNGS